MRKAFWAAINDPEFLAEQEKVKLVPTRRAPAIRLQQLIAKVYQSPANVVERIKKLQKVD